MSSRGLSIQKADSIYSMVRSSVQDGIERCTPFFTAKRNDDDGMIITSNNGVNDSPRLIIRDVVLHVRVAQSDAPGGIRGTPFHTDQTLLASPTW